MKTVLAVIYIVISSSEENTSMNPKHDSSSTTESYEFGDSLGSDLRSIAYYLRQHKFNEYDRRYITDEIEAESSKLYFAGFPKPPLRSLHWEVHKYCEISFLSCIAYLIKRIRNTALRRNDDTSVVMEDQKWFTRTFTEQIDQTDLECRKMWAEAEERADPFEGPIERFQWRVTASYFLCMYTMNETLELEHLNDTSCDNHANCLNPYLGPHNLDIRADDSIPFNCARYSFCPDPCCPIYHIKSYRECWESTANPCFAENHPGHRQCIIHKSENVELKDIILNRWNVSCMCPWLGYKWKSFYGICVDVDECEENIDPCNPLSEACINLPGSYKCVCKWGYMWNKESKKCEFSSIAESLVLRKSTEKENEDNSSDSFFKRIFFRNKEKFFRSLGNHIHLDMTEILLILMISPIEVMF
ncbi:hypothetical protein HHI36_000389 [Cryptolaemus montrouzieri]|uniref:EGF-like domain-containing protein n=1 Tax=Cryptolaemus montrouzieri TaxID=559131 RepID=A0ABD2P4J1_9CUCU